MIDRRKYQMKNELLIKLREVFQMHADSLPDCTEFPAENDMYACRKKVYYHGKSVGSSCDTAFVYAYYFENVVAKGYPLKLVTETLIEHDILIPDATTGDAYTMKETRENPEKVYAVQYDILMYKHGFMKQEIMKQRADAKIFDGSNERLEVVEKALLEVLNMISGLLRKDNQVFSDLEKRVAKIEKTIIRKF